MQWLQHPALTLPPEQLAGRIQHALIGQAITERMVRQHVEETARFGFDAAIVPPSWVWAARDELKGTSIRVGSFIDFPYGTMTTAGRVAEVKALVEAGVDELDSTINVGYLLSHRVPEFVADLRAIVAAAAPIGVKLMLELPLLSPAQRTRVVEAAIDVGVAFVSTSSRGAVGIADAGTVSWLRRIRSRLDRGQGLRWHQDAGTGPHAAGGRCRPDRHLLGRRDRRRPGHREGLAVLVLIRLDRPAGRPGSRRVHHQQSGAAVTLVAGIDSSTQSTKVLLVRAEDGVVVDQASAPHPTGTETDPADWWVALQQAGSGLLERAAAIGVGGQQHGMVALDAAGAVIRPAILWNDLRSAPQAAEVVDHLGGPDDCAKAIGFVPTASMTVTKLRWMAEHEPDNAARTTAVGASARLADLAAARRRSGRRFAGPAGVAIGADHRPRRRLGYRLLLAVGPGLATRPGCLGRGPPDHPAAAVGARCGGRRNPGRCAAVRRHRRQHGCRVGAGSRAR